MGYEEIRYAVEDSIATVTLSRPEKLNAWTPLMEREVGQAMETAERDVRVRVIALTGGGRGFCAGSPPRPQTSRRASLISWKSVHPGSRGGEGRPRLKPSSTRFP